MKSATNLISTKMNIILNVIFTIFTIMCILPLIITISISLSAEKDILLEGYSIIPHTFTIDSYKFIFNSCADILDSYKVTTGVTVLGTILSVMVVAFYAYPISRPTLKYRKFFTLYIFITMLFNGGLVPWYIVCSQMLHITNSYVALFLPYLFNAWHVIIMRTFYKTTIPDSIIESAKIDGAGELRVFFQIVSPLSKAGYATIALFTTLIFWNDWWLSMILTTDKKYYTLQYFIYKVLTQFAIIQEMATKTGEKGLLEYARSVPAETARFAMCIIAMGPILLAYPFFQRYFIKGMTIGAIKG